MFHGIDISNHNGHPDSYMNADWYTQADFVIVQAIEPPPGYPGYNFIDVETGRRGYTGVQLRRAIQDGKKVSAYVWLWNGINDVFGNILDRLGTIPASVSLNMRVWVDVEDITGGPQGINTVPTGFLSRTIRQLESEPKPPVPYGIAPQYRRLDVEAALNAADMWSMGTASVRTGLNGEGRRPGRPAGMYSGDWYINGYLGGWFPEGRMYWLADYSIPPELFPARPVHQYTSTPVDTNVMDESEIISPEPIPEPEPEPTPACDQAWSDRKSQVVSEIGYVRGDVLDRIYKATTSKKARAAIAEARAHLDVVLQ